MPLNNRNWNVAVTLRVGNPVKTTKKMYYSKFKKKYLINLSFSSFNFGILKVNSQGSSFYLNLSIIIKCLYWFLSNWLPKSIDVFSITMNTEYLKEIHNHTLVLYNLLIFNLIFILELLKPQKFKILKHWY